MEAVHEGKKQCDICEKTFADMPEMAKMAEMAEMPEMADMPEMPEMAEMEEVPEMAEMTDLYQFCERICQKFHRFSEIRKSF